jgi:capsular exopolysaccharide synthesis family protein
LSHWIKSSFVKFGLKDPPAITAKSDHYSTYIDEILARMHVSQVKTSRVLEISFQGNNPTLVAEITNALTNKFIDKSLELNNAWEGSAAGWMENKLTELNAKLKNSEIKLREFKKSKSFIETKDGRDLVSKKWSEISQELTKATSERLRLESQIQELKALKQEPLKLLLSQPFIFNTNLSELQKSYINLNNELNALLKSKTPQHPDVVLLSKKLNLIKQKIPSEVKNFLSSLEINLRSMAARESILKMSLENQQKEIIKNDGDFQQFKFLMQEVELNEKLHTEILNRKKELEVTANFNSSNIRIVDMAEIPYAPIKPKKGRNIILAALIGIFGGFLMIFFQESQDNAIKREEDVEKNLPYFLWGSIVRLSKDIQSSPFSSFDEFRSLKTQLLLKTKNSPSKVFLITSPKPQEGKAFIATNLAVSLGNSGKSVLVIDADFFNAKIASIFNSNLKPGYLDNLDDFSKITHKTNFQNVWVVPPGGPRIESGSAPDVFLSNEFRSFINDAEKKWDYILIKAPPVLATPDAKVLEKLCHGVILILQAGAHDNLNVHKVFDQLLFGQFSQEQPHSFHNENGNNGKPYSPGKNKLLGIVINKVDRKYKQIEYNYYQRSGQ